MVAKNSVVKERPMNKRLREMMSPNTNERAKLLDAMKFHVSTEPEAREDFRNDVQTILEVWDGKAPLVWFTWELGTHLMILKEPNASRSDVFAHHREVNVAVDMARGGDCFSVSMISDSPMISIGLGRARDVVRDYYECKEPLASVHS